MTAVSPPWPAIHPHDADPPPEDSQDDSPDDPPPPYSLYPPPITPPNPDYLPPMPLYAASEHSRSPSPLPRRPSTLYKAPFEASARNQLAPYRIRQLLGYEARCAGYYTAHTTAWIAFVEEVYRAVVAAADGDGSAVWEALVEAREFIGGAEEGVEELAEAVIEMARKRRRWCEDSGRGAWWKWIRLCLRVGE